MEIHCKTYAAVESCSTQGFLKQLTQKSNYTVKKEILEDKEKGGVENKKGGRKKKEVSDSGKNVNLMNERIKD